MRAEPEADPIQRPHPRSTRRGEKSLIAATMFGVTTPCVEAARKQLEEGGYEVLVFHATGTGGMTMESFIKDGVIEGVLDITTTEAADELVGGILSAGKDRLTAAAIRGTPQVISVGALDMVNFQTAETVPRRVQGSPLLSTQRQRLPLDALCRPEKKRDKLGQGDPCQKARKRPPRGRRRVLLPLQGVSAIDRVGQAFEWPEADQALFQSIRNWIGPEVVLLELDRHINDPEFARAAVETLLGLVKRC